ncbi:hypothetical protein [Luteolibacter marinus]|uniref:hypothetical protein n=1 Tax=Luteolibacter marinus TaxID=2776705 RepID=UPI00186686B9|nr:hypothetical protein [Luteolibacter marinus]
MSSPIHTAHDSTGRKSGGVLDLLHSCMEQTIQAIQATGIATDTETARVRTVFERSVSQGEPLDLLEILARVQGTEEEHMGVEVARITHAVSQVIHPSPPLVPFAGKLIAPSAFYESFDHLHKVARALLAPILYAEDTDAIGTGALNPVAARIMADEILATVDRRFAIKPFVTSVRMDYESWTFLTRKHFEL